MLADRHALTDASAVAIVCIVDPLASLGPAFGIRALAGLQPTLDDAIAWINTRPRPLALYLYADDSATIERVTRDTIAGGMTVITGFG